jgi:hypothetical protein
MSDGEQNKVREQRVETESAEPPHQAGSPVFAR